MNRNQENIKRPSSTGIGKIRSIYSSPTLYEKNFTKTDPQLFTKCSKPMMLNENSCYRLASGQRQTFAGWRSPTKPTLPFNLNQSTRKVYFTYLNPSSLAIEKHFIETIVHIPNKPYSNEWEEKYFELQKQVEFFVSSHETMAVELYNLKKELQNKNSSYFMDEQNQSLIFYKNKISELSSNYEDLKVEVTLLKNQNEKTQNALWEAQNELLKEQQNKGFDEKLLYELKKDNQKMVKLLSKMDLSSQITEAQIIINKNLSEENQTICQLTSNIKSMIADTFFKVDRIRKGNNVEMEEKESEICGDLEILQWYILDLNECCEKLIQQIEIEQSNAKLYVNESETKVVQDEAILKTLHSYKEENQNLKQKIKQLIDINNTLASKINQNVSQTTNFDHSYCQEETNKLKSEAAELYDQYNKILAKYEDSEDKKEKLEEKIALFSMEIERLMQIIKENNCKIKLMESQEFSLQQLTLIKTELEEKVLTFDDQNKELTQKVAELELRIQQLVAVKTELEEKVLTFDDQNKELTQKVAEQLNELVFKEDRIKKIGEEYEVLNKEKLELEVRVEELTVCSTMKEKLISSLQETISKLQSEINIHSYQLSCSTKKINEYQNIFESQQVFDSQIEELKGTIKNLEKENELLKLEISKSKGNHLSFHVYDIEYMRSLTLMIETLIDELELKQTHTNQQIKLRLTESFATLFDQILKIYENCSTSTNCQNEENINVKLTENQRIIEDYKTKISVLESKIVQNRSRYEYTAEFIRSILLEIDCLLQNIEELPLNCQIMKIVGIEINKGLYHLETLI